MRLILDGIPLVKMGTPFGIRSPLLDSLLDLSFWSHNDDWNRGMGQAVPANAAHGPFADTYLPGSVDEKDVSTPIGVM